jgi:hypothetical protein
VFEHGALERGLDPLCQCLHLRDLGHAAPLSRRRR